MGDFKGLLPVLGAFVIFCIIFADKCNGNNEIDEMSGNDVYKIEGKVVLPSAVGKDWSNSVRVLVNGGQYLGFLKQDGSFSIGNVHSGSYVVEVGNSDFVFEPARVDITGKGKIRARRLNHLQPSQVQTISYPLKFKAKGRANYFQQREQWRITDLLMNPMVLMMVLPLLMFMVLPKLMNTSDPETQREMQNSMNLLNPRQNMPEISEYFTNFFGGGSGGTKKAIKPKSSKSKSTT